MDDVSDEEGVPEDLKASADYGELLWLKRIRREKELEQREGKNKPTTHFGYKCDGCGKDPILGGRFICVDCAKKGESIDLCCECAPKISQLKRIGAEFGHKSEHTIRPVRKRFDDTHKKEENICGNTRDKDYFVETKMGNYLDPNYQYFK